MTRNRGSLSAMTVCLTLSAMALVGLVFDGGASINEYMRLSDVAENAARVGAQEIVGIRAGNAHIDNHAATVASKKYLQAYGVMGEVSTTRDTITVEVNGAVKYQILGIIGLSRHRLRVTRSAQIVEG